ncbi:MAG: hypothetical protein A2958_01360 [Candidatus Levybacteria bacterium RIFCSPLOWO2_01_FULL_38_13]|nr:MAG: hypothetical protein A2629_01220 [Candidatus Levybacteria bacterium RIFCSPHIGHO2_01_FULL_41_15]OGH35798.1 MAG: hypothetical protein A2958_01360 [Candidatus Levybacteria bacterium RIFCSPLOWO2_01_FULL_38_13]
MAAQKEEKLFPKEARDLPAGKADLPKEPLELQAETQYPHIKTLLSWTAPGRPYKKRTKQYFLTSLLIMLLVQVILFLFSQYLLMLVVLSLVFVAFALAIVPPHNFHYRISTEGITIEDHFFLWQELYDFYFKRVEGIEVLHVRTHAFIPGVLTVPLGNLDVEHVRSVLLPYLPYREVIKPTFMENAGNFLSKNFPLENTKVAS